MKILYQLIHSRNPVRQNKQAMNSKVFILLFLSILTVSCNSKHGTTPRVQVFKFEVDSVDLTKIGYKRFPYLNDYLDLFPTAIAIDNEYAYITDDAHRNVKKINLHDGSIKSSERLIQRVHGTKLNDISVFNNHLVVSTFSDTVFVLNKDLSIDTILTIRTFGKRTCIYGTNEKEVLIYVQNREFVAVVDNSFRVVGTRRVEDIDCEEWLNPNRNMFRGKRAQLVKSGDKEIIRVNGVDVELVKKLNGFRYKYNFDFDDCHMVTFDFNYPKEDLVLYVYDLGLCGDN